MPVAVVSAPRLAGMMGLLLLLLLPQLLCRAGQGLLLELQRQLLRRAGRGLLVGLLLHRA